MKKTVSSIFIAMALVLSAGTLTGYCTQTDNNRQTIVKSDRQDMKKMFEQRLNLTEKQKQKAAEIHRQGRQEMKPVMMKIEVKRQEIETVKLTKISEKAQQERITQLNAEIKELEKQAQEIRKKNTQEFEKLLNKKQKAELEQMKAEGRARFERRHPPRPPFGGLGTPNFLFRPLLPPPQQNETNFWK